MHFRQLKSFKMPTVHPGCGTVITASRLHSTMDKQQLPAASHPATAAWRSCYRRRPNAKHGERRTDVEKYFAVNKLLDDEEWSRWSSREIARQTHTSHPFVIKLRAERAEEAEYAKSLTGNVTSEPATVMYRNRHGGISTTSATRPPTLPPTLRIVETHQPEPTPSLFSAADQAQVDALIEQAISAARETRSTRPYRRDPRKRVRRDSRKQSGTDGASLH